MSALANAIGRAPNNARQVLAVEDAGEGEVVSLTTSTGNYIAEGWLVHNCDTAYTWNADKYDLREQLTRAPVAGVLAEVERHDVPLVVITGGEPLLHQRQEGWRALLDGLKRMGRRVEVETNGTIAPDPYTVACVDAFNVSPKLAHAGMSEERRIRPEVLAAMLDTGKAVFKFVCRTGADVDAVAEIVTDVGIPGGLVWIMPEGRSGEVLAVTTANTVERALTYRFNFTPRLHVALWGDERGR
jgi:organic radical activating enzyme